MSGTFWYIIKQEPTVSPWPIWTLFTTFSSQIYVQAVYPIWANICKIHQAKENFKKYQKRFVSIETSIKRFSLPCHLLALNFTQNEILRSKHWKFLHLKKLVKIPHKINVFSIALNFGRIFTSFFYSRGGNFHGILH